MPGGGWSAGSTDLDSLGLCRETDETGGTCGSGFKPRLGSRAERRGWKPLPRLNLTALSKTLVEHPGEAETKLDIMKLPETERRA